MPSAELGSVGPRPATVDPAGIERQIEGIYRDQFSVFVRVAGAILGDRDQAVDAVQEGFARALVNAGSFRRDGPLEGWVWRVVVNEAKRIRSRPQLRADAAVSEEPAAGSGEDLLWLRRVVAGLPERQRLILFLRYYADLDYASIAVAADVAPGTVAATLSHAHASLLRRLEEAGDAV